MLHIHGIGTRDHQSLMFVREAELERVMGWLVRSGYAGVVTMEVFGVEDFEGVEEEGGGVIQRYSLKE